MSELDRGQAGALQEFETSVAARRVLSIGFLCWISLTALFHLPDRSIRAEMRRELALPAQATNLDVGWSYFAPYPAAETRWVRARVRLADGSTQRIGPPDRSGILGPYRTTRWTSLGKQVHISEAAAANFGRWAMAEVGPEAEAVEVWAEVHYPPTSTSGPFVREIEQVLLVEMVAQR